jgi:hypothetical protein
MRDSGKRTDAADDKSLLGHVRIMRDNGQWADAPGLW